MIFAFDNISTVILTLCAAALHEIGHLTVAMIIKKNGGFKGSYFGLRISIYDFLTYREEIFIAAAGPFANFLVLIALFPYMKSNEYIMIFGVINLMTGLSNLLPIKSFDGNRILFSILNLICEYEKAYRICEIISFATLITLCFFSLYLISKLNTGYLIFFIFFSYFLKSIQQKSY